MAYFSDEDWDYAQGQMSDWFNSFRGFVNFADDPTALNFVKLSAFPVGYATAAYMLSVEGLMTQHLYLIANESGIINPATAVVASALVQQQIGESISELPGHSNVNAQTNVTNIWAGTGSFSGGVMPSVPMDSGSRNRQGQADLSELFTWAYWSK